MTTSLEQSKPILDTIDNLVEIHLADTVHDDEIWRDIGARALIFIDQIITNAQLTNALTPKDITPHRPCILTVIFQVLNKISNVNEPFLDASWLNHLESNQLSDEISLKYSFYELAYSRCCSYIGQLLGDKFHYVQKLLLKNLFGGSKISALLASDVYMFLMRVSLPTHRTALCGIIMNLCKFAPPDALTMGAALIKRAKHPVINFENPKYQYILDFRTDT